MDCIFCQIISKKIPSFKIYEDNQFLGFLDIKPLNPGHSLLIPKIHYRWIYAVPEFGQYWEIAKNIALHTRKILGCDYISFLTMGNEVPHAHIHIIPRFFHDAHRHGIDTNLRIDADFGELKKLADKLKLV